MILHLVPRAAWEAAPERPYAPPGLAVEDFVHCTATPEVLLVVANRFYRDEPGEVWVVQLDEARLRSEVRWERPDGGEGPLAEVAFPHVYGPLDRDAVVGYLRAERGDDGTFLGFVPFTGSPGVRNETATPW